jgi:hypothetical protein
VANEQNLKPFPKGRSSEEARVAGAKGGKASGESRRRKANFKKTLNMLMQMDIDAGEITALLKNMGIETTVENTVNFALVMQAIAGNVKAYNAIRATLGLSDKTDLDEKEQKMRIKEKEGGETRSEVIIIDDI